jgi:glycosyltransferase involved in cell wall biosynthesis
MFGSWEPVVRSGRSMAEQPMFAVPAKARDTHRALSSEQCWRASRTSNPRNLDLVRLLIVANEAAMFRDFLNPFGPHFRRLGWRVDAMARGLTRSNDCKGLFDDVWEISWSRNPLGFENFFQAPLVFRRRVEEAAYDLIHVHTPIPAFVSRCSLAPIAKGRRPRLIYTAHGFHFHSQGSVWKNQMFLGLEKLAGRWTDRLIVINREDQRAAEVHGLVAKGRVVYMPGIGIQRRDYDRDTVPKGALELLRKELSIDGVAPVILMLAEFTLGKRHFDALRAFALMENRAAHLLLAGEGPLMNEVRQLASQLGVERRVHLLGFRRDVPTLLKACTMSILPSEREGLPKSILEALNMRVPVIGSDIRGIRELLGAGVGVLVPLGDIRLWANAMDWVIGNPEQTAAMTQTGYSRMSLYERSRILDLHEQLYRELLDRP